MNEPLRLLIVEDSEEDVALLVQAVSRGKYDVYYEAVQTADALRAALQHGEWDVVTSDHSLPSFSAPAAQAIARALRPELPFIIVSGEIDLNLAVSLMRGGAEDYIQKRELARIVPVVERALRDVKARQDGREAEKALQVSENRYRRLFETAQDGILILDAGTGKIIDVNPFLIDMLGYDRDEFIGKELFEIGPFKNAAASKFAFERLSEKGYVRFENLPLETCDGRRVEVEFVCNVYLVDDARVAQCNIRDITAHKLAERALQKLNLELEGRVRTAQRENFQTELAGFSVSLCQDLRSTLSRIGGLVEVLWEQCADRQGADSMQLIARIRALFLQVDGLIPAIQNAAQPGKGEAKLPTVAGNTPVTVGTKP